MILILSALILLGVFIDCERRRRTDARRTYDAYTTMFQVLSVLGLLASVVVALA